MRNALTVSAAGLALATAVPAQAAIIMVDASTIQGTLVHGTGTNQTAFDVIGNLGSNGPNIVHFTGDTTETLATSDLLQLQGGAGQADITGAEITTTSNPNDVFNILSGNIFLTGNAGIDFIEFALTGASRGTVNFLLTDSLGGTQAFNDVAIGTGNTFYGFDTTGLSSITNIRYSANTPPGAITILKQVRLEQFVAAAVPEPGTWLMMLVGFAGIGMTMRRRRGKVTTRVRFA